MFFNEDILFRNGSLALVWMAGHDEFKNIKGRRQKHFVALLNSSVTDICNDLRRLFPQMGTAHGITLKKMGTLAKGAGIIYRIKIEKFARDVMQANILLKRPVTLQIDMPGERMALNARSKKALDNPIPVNNDIGDLLVNEYNQYENIYMQFDDPLCENGYPSPRVTAANASPRHSDVFVAPIMIHQTPPRGIEEEHGQQLCRGRARRRDESSDAENYEDVLRRLQVAANIDSGAHLLQEDELLMVRDPQQQDLGGDLDFGNGLDLLHTRDECNLPIGGDPDGEDFPLPMRSEVPDDGSSIAMGPPSNVGHDTKPVVELETPSGAGTSAENVRKRRNEDYRDLDETIIEVPQIESVDQRPGKRARRRLKLQIDIEKSISHGDMISRVTATRQENDMDALNELVMNTRATPKRYWTLLAQRNKSAIDFITTAGRVSSSSALNEMVTNIIKKRKEQIPIAERHRDYSWEGTTIAGVSTDTAVDVGRSAAAADDSSQLPDIVVQPQDDCRPFDDGMAPDQQDAYMEIPNPHDDCGEQQNDPFVVPEGQGTRRRHNIHEQVLTENMDRGKTFDKMYPPNVTKKRKAARAFFLLLEMQAKKDVALNQEQSFGPITVANLRPS